MLGFNATILPFAEIPQAFSTGLIEALFTSPQTGIDIQAWDNTSHFTYAGAIYSKNAVIVNLEAWNRLDADVRDAVKQAAERAEIRGWEMSAATTKAQIKILEENGMVAANAPAAVIGGHEGDWRRDAGGLANTGQRRRRRRSRSLSFDDQLARRVATRMAPPRRDHTAWRTWSSQESQRPGGAIHDDVPGRIDGTRRRQSGNLVPGHHLSELSDRSRRQTPVA